MLEDFLLENINKKTNIDFNGRFLVLSNQDVLMVIMRLKEEKDDGVKNKCLMDCVLCDH